jgi:phage shock protein A
VGIGFDVNEILVGYRNVDQIEQALSKAQKAYAELGQAIEDAKPKLKLLKALYDKWLVSIESIQENASAIREALQKEIKSNGYRPSR